MSRPFASLLVANRGEIALRIMRTARRLGIFTIAVYSDADAQAAHVAAADRALRIGPAPARDSYLNIDAVIEAARKSGAEAIHPGYGFLSENAEFAEACRRVTVVFVGPSPEVIRAMGLKDRAKALMQKAGVAVVPGYMGEDRSAETLLREASRIGFPVLIKAVAGGGGKGMRRVDEAKEFAAALAGAQREALSAFGDKSVFLEKYVCRPRHIEVQVFGDRQGNVVHLFERDCSLQRRHQKVIEEAPAPGMDGAMRARMNEAAVTAARAVGYVGAGTIEFIADASEGLRPDRFWFMEMNTRLQVEHPVTEAITGIDLVEWQLRIAAGEPLPKSQEDIAASGHAVEARLYAEDPENDFRPSVGKLERFRLPEESRGLRVDAGVREGDAVTPYYDPMIAKVVAWASTRDEAIALLAGAFAQSEIAGVNTNAGFVVRVLRQKDFLAGDIDTDFAARHISSLVRAGGVPSAVLARAAAFGLDERRSRARASSDPWDVRDGFRLAGDARETIDFAVENAPAVQIVHCRDGKAAVFVNRNRVEPIAHAAAMRLASGAIAVMHEGDTFVLPLRDPFARAEEEGDALDFLTAPMPGKVVQLLVKAGDDVARGVALAVLEAMKMEHTLAAPADGKVEAVEVAQGDQVAEGAVILRFAKSEERRAAE